MTNPDDHNDLKTLVRKLIKDGPIRIMQTPKRIRLLFNGAFIADTTSAIYVWEHEYYPQLYLPMECFVQPPGFDVSLSHGEAITDNETGTGHIIGGLLELAVRSSRSKNEEYRIIDEMVLFAADLDGESEPLRDYVKVVFNAVDQWFEEDTPIAIHPKSPLTRIDTLLSTRPIRITLPNGGPTLAESSHSIHLHETLLPPRYYLPLTSLNQSYLRPSATTSECPYKGTAEYSHVVLDNGEVYRDLVWWYRAPSGECADIRGLRCFWGERVDVWILEGGGSEREGGKWRRVDRPVAKGVGTGGGGGRRDGFF